MAEERRRVPACSAQWPRRRRSWPARRTLDIEEKRLFIMTASWQALMRSQGRYPQGTKSPGVSPCLTYWIGHTKRRQTSGSESACVKRGSHDLPPGWVGARFGPSQIPSTGLVQNEQFLAHDENIWSILCQIRPYPANTWPNTFNFGQHWPMLPSRGSCSIVV